MEALAVAGGAAALTELLRSTKDAIEICQSIWNAPEEIHNTAVECELLSASIERFLSLCRHSRGLVRAADDDSRLLKQYVKSAQAALDQIHYEFQKELKAPSFHGRLRWGIWSKQKVNFLLSRLLRIQASAGAAMQLVSM